MHKFAVIVTGDEAFTASGEVFTQKGQQFWVLIEPEGWVPATSIRYNEEDALPSKLKTFKTREAAERFATRWDGHPWWCKPISFKVVEIKEKFKRISDGYELTGGEDEDEI